LRNKYQEIISIDISGYLSELVKVLKSLEVALDESIALTKDPSRINDCLSSRFIEAMHWTSVWPSALNYPNFIQKCVSKMNLFTGREGVSDQPWLGSWNDNVTVSMVSCGGDQSVKGSVRFDDSSNVSNIYPVHCLGLINKKWRNCCRKTSRSQRMIWRKTKSR